MFASYSKALSDRERGFTLIELVVVLAILGILISLAIPRYLGARKKAYKVEADNLLQEAKTLEWAYFQQYDSFDTTGASIGFVMPGGSHWNPPSMCRIDPNHDDGSTKSGGSHGQRLDYIVE